MTLLEVSKSHLLKCQKDTEIRLIVLILSIVIPIPSIPTEMSGKEAKRCGEDYFRESLELDYLSRDRTLDQDTIQAMVDLMVDVCCSTRKSIRINREDMPIEVVKSRFMKLDSM